MRVRLTRKLANRVNGIDLTHRDVGDMIDLPEREAQVIVAERWATMARRAGDMAPELTSQVAGQSMADDSDRLNTDRRSTPLSSDVYRRLRDKRAQIEWERRRFTRRATDEHPPTTHAA